ncbi:hypothetical protein A2955_05055 [Candidatus Woesebacteria bacterium RIFCSPLOWO2_01_FULL_37_19]|uniref:F0F1 ATP synthase subunit alpha n=2 Tax=Candidatus Woeseibacteriota TaxID=1752722 RepID=A0A1F8B023_9BACT|nr:MAG: hypothetical protein A2771_03260 [Candidatus Woesebacteria bacterium RIFCSPHIGHO2_01_FULL_38_26b]OGM57334.1 MAG: hypothetical protein A2955_05055 [Candidatus Woesebacteria bacterium RIFCSPLOWO2_01_FULL_37_19]
MKDFNYYLETIGEIGFVEEVVYAIAYVSGLPNAHPDEVVIFETGEIGEVISLSQDNVEILLLSRNPTRVGTKVVRTGELFQIPISDEMLGRLIDPLGNPIDGAKQFKNVSKAPIDMQPHGIIGRESIKKPFETGVTIVDLVIPLGKGQRELVIGDRKTGKTQFLLDCLLSQAAKGSICIYAVIGQRLLDIRGRHEYLIQKKVMDKCIMVASSSSDPAGLVYLTPYVAMSIAEHFRDKGMDVLLILDDMTSHARYYREISLLAKRFPGRSSYPGDIFYIHAKLIERAGNFKKGSITCLPVAESIMGDLTGYIQTNLMAMTDGHIFFDIELFNQGKRPSIHPGLSVTRVGHQAQTPLQQDLSQVLSNFLVKYSEMQQFMHFGAEAGENVKRVLQLGEKIDAFFNQLPDQIIPINANILLAAGLWAGLWNEVTVTDLKRETEQVILAYQTEEAYRSQIDSLINSSNIFDQLVTNIKQNNKIIIDKLNRSK